MFSKTKTKVKILLVEDEEITANLEKIMLENYGYNVQTVNTGEKAIEVVNKNADIDLILMDIDLGEGIDGTETAKIILQKRDIPVVFLSSHIEPEIVEKTEKITSYGYIVKGSSITVIDASIKMGLKLFNEKIERKQVELELRKERERLEYILSITKTGIDIIDTDFNLLYVDKRWQKIYGDPSERKCYEYFDGFNEPCQGCGIPNALETKSVVINEQRLPRENNRIVEVYTIPFQDFKGQWLVAEFNVDISERKQMEYKLKKSEEKLSSILNNITDVVWSISWPDLKHYYISPSAEKLYGRPNKEFFDNPILFKEVTHPDDQHLTEKAIKQLMKEGQSIRECRIVRPDGSIIWIEDRAKMIYDENIMPIKVEGVTRDITARKQAEEKILNQKEQLEVANAEKEVLLNEIHHRVKNNL